MKVLLKKVYGLYRDFSSLYFCVVSGISYKRNYHVRGRIIVKKGWILRPAGDLIIGENFIANGTLASNSIGIIQPIVLNITVPRSRIIIGNNVGISGSTLNSSNSIRIGNNVLIGSGCLITDSDSHPLKYDEREDYNKVISKPIVIGDDVFIGARS